MVPIRTNGSTPSLYLDIHHVELNSGGGDLRMVVSAVLGDGWYEGEVAVEIGPRSGVTFADAYLDEQRMADFFTRVDRAELERALVDAVGTLVFSVGKPGARQRIRAYRHDDRILSLPGRSPRRAATTKRPPTHHPSRLTATG
ncbi:hypothetical protein [Geoalkalibacter halelectricus]|uniref:Uncharacterized protein n=1 Tax=Geoalkalibacter halelectricus TaxID=2847045 RepID=A0ABY5ZI41_9BACT|nr:hypothetical protein [Geoalkalibacter halelectricus]MDO3379530.1 hypothetical protein [Geoalkalibacter halelectricus]UWZ78119.1 hypothetical protein L9S41_10450 [Geoalkalibacter halelectricus]